MKPNSKTLIAILSVPTLLMCGETFAQSNVYRDAVRSAEDNRISYEARVTQYESDLRMKRADAAVLPTLQRNLKVKSLLIADEDRDAARADAAKKKLEQERAAEIAKQVAQQLALQKSSCVTPQQSNTKE